MSAKDLFKANKYLPAKSADEVGREIESATYLKEYFKKEQRHVPPVDYSDPKNFAKFGSAEQYYLDALDRVRLQYPYDGSKAEKLKWHNENTDFDNYIFENTYPRSTGYVVIHTASISTGSVVQSGYLSSSSPEYINISSSLSVGNVYDIAKNRESNLLIDGNKGNTVEFWIKKSGFGDLPDQREVIFDNWLSGTDPSDDNYGRFKVELKNTGMPFVLTYRSGSSGFHEVEMGGDTLEDSPQLFTASALATFRHETNAQTDWETATSIAISDTTITSGGVGDGSWYFYNESAQDGNSDRFEINNRFPAGFYRVSIDAQVVTGSSLTTCIAGWSSIIAANGGAIGVLPSSGSWTRVVFDINASVGYSGIMRFYNTFAGLLGDAIALDNLSIHALPCSSSTFVDNEWHHYAVTVQNSGSSLVAKLYRDGTKIDEVTKSNASVDYVSGSMIGRIGTLAAPFSSSVYWTTSSSDLTADLIQTTAGYGQLSASLDEFRYWKRARTAEQIGKWYIDQVGGGTNTDDANTDLGVYYKFNEGVTGFTGFDNNILDYSGRLSHGVFHRYGSENRNTGSAMVSASVATYEFADPILYKYHPLVTGSYLDLQKKGREYDYRNAASMYRLFPQWIIEQDQEKDRKVLLKLTQILASYFDSLYLQIEHMPKLTYAAYLSGTTKPAPFTNRVLESVGFVAPDMFVESDVLEYFAKRNDRKLFEEELYNVKNTIYQNIYNNIPYILKSKGTEKAFRNLIRCYGIGDELLRLNTYANNAEFLVKENYLGGSLKKKYVDFNNADRFDGVVYQFASASDSDQQSYLSGAANPVLGMTYQTEVYFPEKFNETSDLFQDTPFISSSLFGIHDARDDYTDTTWASGDVSNFQVYAVRDRKNSRDVYFKLTSSTGGPFTALTSSLFRDVYLNTRWNLSVRVRPSKYPATAMLTGTAADSYVVEFYGYNYESGELRNNFAVSGTVTAAAATASLNAKKRLYVGAHRTNFTGTVLQRSDAKISSARVWYSYLENETLRAHAIDASSYGSLNPSRNYPGIHSSSFVPERETLALNWEFSNVTGSDTSGQFIVNDLNSGSYGSRTDFAHLGTKTNIKHPGRGDKFPASSTQVVDTEYIHSFKMQPPDVINSSDMVNILGDTDKKFTRETRPMNYFFAVEKSMHQVISEDMMRMFATMKDFHNLIGHPVNRYRMRYKDLDYLRSVYFRRVENEPDFEKFVDYYKWIDSSIGTMINQLVPASADFASDVRTVIESHVLERNKYWNKFPTQEKKENDLIGSMRGINELRFNWRYGHRPLDVNNQLHTHVNIITPTATNVYGAEIHTASNAASDPNGNEVSGTTGWTVTNGALSVPSDDPASGSYYLKQEHTAGGLSFAKIIIPATSGKKYLVSYNARKGDQGSLQRIYSWGGVVSSPDHVGAGLPNTWTYFEDFVEANASTMQLNFYAAYTAGTIGDSIEIDNLSVREALPSMAGWTRYTAAASASFSSFDFINTSPAPHTGGYIYRISLSEGVVDELRYNITTAPGRTIRLSFDSYLDEGEWLLSAQGIGVQSISQSLTPGAGTWAAHQVDMTATSSNVTVRIVSEVGADTTGYLDAVSIREIYTPENQHCLYWNKKAERDDAPLSSGISAVDTSRRNIWLATTQSFNRKLDLGYNFGGELVYNNTAKLNDVNKKSQYAKALLEFGTTKYLEIGTSSVNLNTACEDGDSLVFKKKMEFKVTQYD